MTLTLEQLNIRVQQMDKDLARAQGALMATRDVLTALIASHPDPAAALASVPATRNFSAPSHKAAYAEFLEGLRRT